MTLERMLKKAQGKNVPPIAKAKKPDPATASAQGLRKAIDTYMNDRNVTHIKKINGFHPSYTKTCARWWFLLFKGSKSIPKINPRLYRIFDNGHKVHERLDEYFEAMGILVDKEIPLKISEPVPIVGTADGVIDWGGHKLIELKSISDEGFQYRKFYNKPKDDHYIQSQIYMHALKLEDGFVIYESKNTQEILVFPIKKDDEAYDKKIRQWSKVYAKIMKDELPKRPYKRDSKHCITCDLSEICWDDLDD